MSNDFLNSFFGSKQEPPKRKRQIVSQSNDVEHPKDSVLYKGYYFTEIKRSKNPLYKYDAIYINAKTGKNRKISFGDKKEKDFTQHKNKELRNFYDFKYQKKQNWNDLMSNGALSKYILWNKESIEGSLKDYKKRLKNGK